MKDIFILMLAMFVSLSACAVKPEGQPLTISLNAELENGFSIQVVIEKASFEDDFAYQNPMLWGAELQSPETITSKISVNLNGKSGWVRFSAYSDLVNVTQASIEVNDSGFQLTIDGGQSATHYLAKLNFDSEGYLTSRKVYSPKFPDEVWEETHYSFIRRNDM